MHNRWHPDLEPVAAIAPGDEIRLETEDGLAGQLTRESTHADAGTLDLGLGHPLSGPVYVEGAEPGDASRSSSSRTSRPTSASPR